MALHAEVQRVAEECTHATLICEALTPINKSYRILMTVGNEPHIQEKLISNPLSRCHINMFLIGHAVDLLDKYVSTKIVNQNIKIHVWVIPFSFGGAKTLSSSPCKPQPGVVTPPSSNPPSTDLTPTLPMLSLTTVQFRTLYNMICEQYECGVKADTDSLPCPSQEECIVCLDRSVSQVLPCGHCFCSSCIHLWDAVGQSCPLCRAVCDFRRDTWDLVEVPTKEITFQRILGLLKRFTGCGSRDSPVAPMTEDAKQQLALLR